MRAKSLALNANAMASFCGALSPLLKGMKNSPSVPSMGRSRENAGCDIPNKMSLSREGLPAVPTVKFIKSRNEKRKAKREKRNIRKRSNSSSKFRYTSSCPLLNPSCTEDSQCFLHSFISDVVRHPHEIDCHVFIDDFIVKMRRISFR